VDQSSLSRSAQDIVTNEVKLVLGAQNTNIRSNTVLHRFVKLGIGRKKISNGTTPNQKHMRENWFAKLPAQASQARKENKPQTKTKTEISTKTKIKHSEKQNSRCKERMSKV